ncbi:hypothetical protein SASPL_151490 [Salvia splendens]|uniref:FH2 domain-containing protein n=1 Tax=Salvia splendens TaxID=180675 RepID=A0A8X8Z2Q4_SALSN|nr:hypothetical protein SASPL_151490 [Salvia splendens]
MGTTLTKHSRSPFPSPPHPPHPPVDAPGLPTHSSTPSLAEVGPPLPLPPGLGAPDPPTQTSPLTPPPSLPRGAPYPPPSLVGAPPGPLVEGGPSPPPPPPPPPGPPPPPRALGRGIGVGRWQAHPNVRKSNLKPFYWVKVGRAQQGSVWEELQNLGTPQLATEFDASELETLFCVIEGKTGAKKFAAKPTKIQLIDLKRAYNVEIMLAKVKMPLPDMMTAVLSLDDTYLDADQVENLIKFCPNEEDKELLKAYTGDPERLGKCEQFFLELMKVPRVEAKFSVFVFKIQFNSQALAAKNPDLLDFHKDLPNLEASTKVLISTTLQDVTAILLNFAKQFQKACEENIQQAEADRKKAENASKV